MGTALVEPRKQLVDARERPARRPIAAGTRGKSEIFLDGQVGEDAAVFRHEREPAARDRRGPRTCDVATVELDAAGARTHQAHQGAQQRRLAHAVAAEQAHGLARHYAEIDPAQDMARPIISIERLRAQRRRRRRAHDAASALAKRPR